MSSPPNRLASYRSYSYYHILAICDSTATASALVNTRSLDKWQHTPINSIPNGRYSAKTIKISDSGNSAINKYCILINGSTDAAYVINTITWSATTAGGATPADRYTSVALEGALEISEPKGIVFLDQIIKCCNELRVDSSNAVFVLKTVFTGFGYEPTIGDFTDVINDISPIMFTITNVTGSFDQSGGTYHIDGVSCVDGTARLPQYSKAGNAISVTAKDTLKLTLEKFATQIQANYDRYFACVHKQLQQAFIKADPGLSAAQASALVDDSICPVKYVIQVGTEYQNPKYKVEDTPEQTSNTTGCESKPVVNIPPHTSIEDGISRIMHMSSQVNADAATGDTTGNTKGIKYEFKVRSAVSSKRVGTRMEYTVYYIVQRFMKPKDVATQHAMMDASTAANPIFLQPILADNIIKFDYIYTGKNIDILEFDMKVNAGLAYLQTATTANSYRGQLEITQVKASGTSQADITTMLARGGTTIPAPVYFGSQINSPLLRQTQDANRAIQAAYTLTKHASIELSEVTMKIVGNPDLFSSVTATSSPETLTTTDPSTFNGVASVTPQNANFKHWSYFPAFAKVKVKMPRNNDDISAFSGATNINDANTGNLDYAQDFWFDGYYYVLGVEHTFDSGVFTQTFHMLGIVPDNAITALSMTSSAGGIDLAQQIDDCFDSKVPCGQPTTSTAPDKKPASAAISQANPCDAPKAAAAAGNNPCNNVPATAASGTPPSSSANNPVK